MTYIIKLNFKNLEKKIYSSFKHHVYKKFIMHTVYSERLMCKVSVINYVKNSNMPCILQPGKTANPVKK